MTAYRHTPMRKSATLS